MINTTPIVVNHYDVTSDANASGDAVQSDVALGKKFSSVAGTNITGTASLGVVNTGNAAVGDVASGKTFSSALLTNASGTSTKNATVPADAPFLPAQAYVDHFLHADYLSEIDLPSKGVTSFKVDYLTEVADILGGDAPDLILSGNAITTANVNAILAWYIPKDFSTRAGDGIINLSGGTNGAPTGQGLTDKAALITAGWSVTTN